MSIKIYRAWRTSISSIGDLMKTLKPLGENIETLARIASYEKLAEVACYAFDKATLGNPFVISEVDSDTKKIQPYAFARNLIMHTANEIVQTRRRNPEFDFEFELMIYPVDNGILLEPNIDNNYGYFEAIEGVKEFFEYGYWDNTDKPDEISDDEWDSRREAWDPLLSDRRCISGFSYKPLPTLGLLLRPTVNDVIECVPSMTKRAGRHVEVPALYLEHTDAEGIKEVSEAAQFMDAMNKWQEGDGQEIVKEEFERIKSKLKNTLAPEDIIDQIDIVIEGAGD